MEQTGLPRFLHLVNQEGRQQMFELLGLIPYEGQWYIVVLPDGDDSREVAVFQVETDDETRESYVTVEREDVARGVFRVFLEQNAHRFQVSPEESDPELPGEQEQQEV